MGRASSAYKLERVYILSDLGIEKERFTDKDRSDGESLHKIAIARLNELRAQEKDVRLQERDAKKTALEEKKKENKERAQKEKIMKTQEQKEKQIMTS